MWLPQKHKARTKRNCWDFVIWFESAKNDAMTTIHLTFYSVLYRQHGYFCIRLHIYLFSAGERCYLRTVAMNKTSYFFFLGFGCCFVSRFEWQWNDTSLRNIHAMGKTTWLLVRMWIRVQVHQIQKSQTMSMGGCINK